MGFLDFMFGDRSADDNSDNKCLHCPQCGSCGISSEKTGFDFRDAFVGNMLFGNNGWLFGFRNHDRMLYRCDRCGYSWRSSG